MVRLSRLGLAGTVGYNGGGGRCCATSSAASSLGECTQSVRQSTLLSECKLLCEACDKSVLPLEEASRTGMPGGNFGGACVVGAYLFERSGGEVQRGGSCGARLRGETPPATPMAGSEAECARKLENPTGFIGQLEPIGRSAPKFALLSFTS